MMKKKILSAVLALSMVAALAGCGGASSAAPSSSSPAPSSEAASGAPASEAPAAPSEEAIKIGFIGPLTGGAAIYGTAAKNGAQIAVDEINALGGMQFAFNPQDDEHDAEKSVTVDGEPVQLTPIEYNILHLLMRNPNRVFSSTQIYELVWNENAYGSESAVAVHIRHLREKIEINPSEPRYIKVVWGQGYKMEGKK